MPPQYRNTMSGGSDPHRKYFRGINEGRGVRTELREEEANSVNDDTWHRLLFKIRQECHGGKCNRHHHEAEHLDGLASKLVHGESRLRIAWRSKNHEDQQ